MKFINRTSGVLKYFSLLVFSAAIFWGCESPKETAENVVPVYPSNVVPQVAHTGQHKSTSK